MIIEEWLKKLYELVYDFGLMPSEHFVHLYYDMSFIWNNGDVFFVLTQHAELEFDSTSPPKHQSTSINKTQTRGTLSLQPAFYTYSLMLCAEQNMQQAHFFLVLCN